MSFIIGTTDKSSYLSWDDMKYEETVGKLEHGNS